MSTASRLTKRTIDALAVKDRRYDVWDGQLPNFGLRVEMSGRKTFFIRYRAEGGGRSAPRRFMVVGQYGVLSVDEARKEARKLLSTARIGGDPAVARSTKRREMTVAELMAVYAHEGVSHMKPRTQRYTLARLNNHVLPLLGNKKISDVTAGDIDRMATQIAAGKTQVDTKRGYRARCIVRGGHGAAAKVVRDLSAMFSFAQADRLIAQNACAGVRKRPDGAKERYLTRDELSRLGAALSQAQANGSNRMGVQIIRLLAVTGCRRDEIAGLRWAEVDFADGCLRLAETKTGKSVRPLGDAAMQLLLLVRQDQRDQGMDTPWVFPASSGASHFQGLKRVWRTVIQLAGLKDCTPHTLRHTLASLAASDGESLLIIGALLGHKNARSTGRYAHIARSPSKDAMDRHTRRIHDAMHVTS